MHRKLRLWLCFLLALVPAGCSGTSAVDDPEDVGTAVDDPEDVGALDEALGDQGTDFCKENTCDPNCHHSPIILDLSGDGFNETDVAHGVTFDISGSGHPWQIAWTTATDDDAFLVLDLNGNGLIDNGTELFGDVSPQQPTTSPNGFLSLGVYDTDKDGKITASDLIWPRLQLWQDKNHNAISEPDELHPLSFFGVTGIGVNYSTTGQFHDLAGNLFAFKSAVTHSGSYNVGPYAWDVFFKAGIIPTGNQNYVPWTCSGGGMPPGPPPPRGCAWRTDCFQSAVANNQAFAYYCAGAGTGQPAIPPTQASPYAMYTFSRYGIHFEDCSGCTTGTPNYLAFLAACQTYAFTESRQHCVDAQASWTTLACYNSDAQAHTPPTYNSGTYVESSEGGVDAINKSEDLVHHPVIWLPH